MEFLCLFFVVTTHKIENWTYRKSAKKTLVLHKTATPALGNTPGGAYLIPPNQGATEGLRDYFLHFRIPGVTKREKWFSEEKKIEIFTYNKKCSE